MKLERPTARKSLTYADTVLTLQKSWSASVKILQLKPLGLIPHALKSEETKTSLRNRSPKRFHDHPPKRFPWSSDHQNVSMIKVSFDSEQTGSVIVTQRQHTLSKVTFSKEAAATTEASKSKHRAVRTKNTWRISFERLPLFSQFSHISQYIS